MCFMFRWRTIKEDTWLASDVRSFPNEHKIDDVRGQLDNPRPGFWLFVKSERVRKILRPWYRSHDLVLR